MRCLVLLGFILGLSALPAQAEKTMYVIDQITITLRSGEGPQHPIVRTIPSGTSLEVLRTSEDGYAQVRTKNGTQGWVQGQYLIDQPTAKLKLAALEPKLARLESENAELKSKLDALSKEKSNLDNKPSGANSSLKISDENKALAAAKVALEKETEMLRQENQLLKDRTRKEWFIAGGVVMLLGLFIGLIFPRVRLRRSSWGDQL